MIATEFLRKYRDSKAIALKEYYNYSPKSTYTEVEVVDIFEKRS